MWVHKLSRERGAEAALGALTAFQRQQIGFTELQMGERMDCSSGFP